MLLKMAQGSVQIVEILLMRGIVNKSLFLKDSDNNMEGDEMLCRT